MAFQLLGRQWPLAQRLLYQIKMRSRLLRTAAFIGVFVGACTQLDDPAPNADRSDSVIGSNWLWPRGDVYLMVDTDFWTFNVANAVDETAQELADNTGIRLHLIQNESEAPDGYFTKFSGQFGIQGGSAPVGISEGGDAVATGGSTRHEIGHILGMQHTQTRVDRDQYITIHPQNIKPGKEGRFEVYDGYLIGPYDVTSVMQYDSKAFSTDLCATLSLGQSDPEECIWNPLGERMVASTTEWSEWNYVSLAVLYCVPEFCGENCASAQRCTAPKVQSRLAHYARWQQSPEGQAQAAQYPDYLPQ